MLKGSNIAHIQYTVCIAYCLHKIYLAVIQFMYYTRIETMSKLGSQVPVVAVGASPYIAQTGVGDVVRTVEGGQLDASSPLYPCLGLGCCIR
jgi:hypothetical protein